MIIAKLSDAPKYQPRGKTARDVDNGAKIYLLDTQSGNIVKEVSADFYFSEMRDFAFGAEFVSSEGETKFALVNKDNDLITEFRFDGHGEFREGLAAVCMRGGWGYINSGGDFVITPRFRNAGDFENGLAAVQDAKTGRYGYIDRRGELVVDYHDYLFPFSEGLAFAKNKDSSSFKFYDEKGSQALVMKKPLTAFSGDDIRALHDFALLEFENSISPISHCALNDLGFRLINDGFYDRDNLEFCRFHDGLCQFVERTGDGPKLGFYDKSGSIAAPAEFDFVSRFYDGLAFYSNGSNIFDCKSGILTPNGKKIEIGDYYWAFQFRGEKRELFRVRANRRDGKPNANGKYGFVDRVGKLAIKPEFDRVYEFDNGRCKYNEGFLTGVINEKGERVIPAEYDGLAFYGKYGLSMVSKYGKQGRKYNGIVDQYGNLIAPIVFEELNIRSKDRFTARSGNGFGLFDIHGTPVSGLVFGGFSCTGDPHYAFVDFALPERGYEPAGRIFRADCGEGIRLYFYKRDNQPAEEHGHDFGLMKKDGTILTGEIFQHIGTYNDGLICGENAFGGNDYIDRDGKPVLYNFTDNGSVFVDGLALVITHDCCSPRITDVLWARFDRERQRYVPRNLPLDKPLDDGRQKFFINKLGDIMDLSIEEQEIFLRKYYELCEKSKNRKWRVEEYAPEASNPEK